MSQLKIFNDFNIDNVICEKDSSKSYIHLIKFDDTHIDYFFQSPWFQSVNFPKSIKNDSHYLNHVSVFFGDNSDNKIFLEKMENIDNLILSNLKSFEREKYINLIRKRKHNEYDDLSSVTKFMNFKLNKNFLDKDLDVSVYLKKTNIDGIKTNEQIAVSNIQHLEEVLKPYSDFRFIFTFKKNLIDSNDFIILRPIIHSIQAKGKNNIFRKIYRGIESSSFECTICFQEDCTIKHKYECCKKEVCYDCYDEWKNKTGVKVCPYCRSKT